MLKLGLPGSLRQRATGGFDPASLFSGGAGAYFDPNDLSTMYQSGTRGTPGTASAVGDPVGLWLDKSGNNNDATQGTAAARPILRQSGSLYYLEFDGVDDHLILPTSLLTGWTSGTGIFAAKRDVDPPAGASDAGPVLGDFGSHSDRDFEPWPTGAVITGWLSTARKDAIAADPGDMAAWHVHDYRSAANDWKAAFNGTNYMTTATNTVGAGGAPQIGRSSFGGNNSYWDGPVGRILVKNSVLSGTDLSNARTWVGAGSGVSL